MPTMTMTPTPTNRTEPLIHRCGRWGRLAGETLLDVVLPQTCVVSNAWITSDRPALSPTVVDALEKLAAVPYCPRCARNARPETVYEGRCGVCRRERHWNLRALVRLGPYQSALRPLLLQMKFDGDYRAIQIIADQLATRMAATPWVSQLDALVPVPMHRLRRWQRPCAHATLLAEALGRRLQLPVWRAVRRVRYAPSQASTNSREERFKQVRGALAPVRGARLNGRTVCVVDNLLTTGATLCETAKALRRGGVRVVYGCVAAHAVSAASFEPRLLEEAK